MLSKHKIRAWYERVEGVRPTHDVPWMWRCSKGWAAISGPGTLGDEGWLKAVRLEDYAPRRPRRPRMPQQALFAYHEA
jgi:hypothetical protein